jgi:hypothetical protein
MTIDARTVQDSILKGNETYNQFMKSFDARWNMPLTDAAAKMLWSVIPQQTKEQLKQTMPEQYRNVERKFSHEL